MHEPSQAEMSNTTSDHSESDQDLFQDRFDEEDVAPEVPDANSDDEEGWAASDLMEYDDGDVQAEGPHGTNDKEEEEDSLSRDLASSSDPIETLSVDRVFSFLDNSMSREIAERFLGKRNWYF